MVRPSFNYLTNKTMESLRPNVLALKRALVAVGAAVVGLAMGGCVEVCKTDAECSDGIDNDHDGLVDSEDDGCVDGYDNFEGEGDNKAEWQALADGERSCFDGVDNDGNGWMDWEDPTCGGLFLTNPSSIMAVLEADGEVTIRVEDVEEGWNPNSDAE